MAKGEYCAEPGCERLVAAANESKCSKHRVKVGQKVQVRVQRGMTLYLILDGEIKRVNKSEGLVAVDFGTEDLWPCFETELFKTRHHESDDVWLLEANLSLLEGAEPRKDQPSIPWNELGKQHK